MKVKEFNNFKVGEQVFSTVDCPSDVNEIHYGDAGIIVEFDPGDPVLSVLVDWDLGGERMERYWCNFNEIAKTHPDESDDTDCVFSDDDMNSFLTELGVEVIGGR